MTYRENIKHNAITYVLVGCLFVAALVKALSVAPVKEIRMSHEQILEYDAWTTVQQEIQGVQYSDHTCVVPDGMGDDMVLAVKNFDSSVTVFLEEEPIYVYEDTYGEKGVWWKWVELPKDAAGKTLLLRISKSTEKNARRFKGVAYLGDKNTVYLTIIQQNIYAILGGTFMELIGLSLCLSNLAMRRKMVKELWRGQNYLGIYIAVSGAWFVLNSNVMQFVTDRAGVISLLSSAAFMLMPYFLLRFIEKMVIYKKKPIRYLRHMYFINLMVSLTLYFFRVVSLHEYMKVTHLLLVVSVFIVLKNARIEIVKHKNYEMRKIAAGLGVLALCGGAAMALYYRDITSRYDILYGIGIVIFAFTLIGAVFDRMRYYFDMGTDAERYKKMAQTDEMTHMGNRLAFTKQQERGDGKQNRGYVVLDINNLKYVNDNLGHQEGDKLIEGSAKCILEAFREYGKCYRIGGDEFAVILSSDSEKEAQTALSRLEQVIRRENESREYPIEIAYGYALMGKEEMDHQAVFQKADANMYRKKKEMKKLK